MIIRNAFDGSNRAEYRCQHCGRIWTAPTKGDRPRSESGGWTGFLASAVQQHKRRCVDRTPEQRVEQAYRDHKRLAKRPNKHTSVYDPLIGMMNGFQLKRTAAVPQPPGEV